MRYFIATVVFLLVMALPASALDITAPPAPDSVENLVPENPETFSQGLWKILKEAVVHLQPAIADAAGICLQLIAVVMLVSIIQNVKSKPEPVAALAGCVAISLVLLKPSQTFIHLGADTVSQMSEYGKLLVPVMTTALAANGGTTSSAALYAGTAFFNAILGTIISSLLVPLIYIFICLGTANAAIGNDHIAKLKGNVKWLMTWTLKTILYVFTGYMGITRVVSGSTDAAALKATKLTISGMVPVVGGILSDASEAILVGAGVVKSSVGIYGLLVIISLWIGPFIQIGVQYLMLKLAASICDIIGGKRCVSIIKDFSTAMGLLLAMTGAMCLLLLISTVCFMKGAG